MSITDETRREANEAVPRSEHEKMVVDAFFVSMGPMTARQTVRSLNERTNVIWDINMVRPRLTELTDKGVLEVACKVWEQGGRRRVAAWQLVKR